MTSEAAINRRNSTGLVAGFAVLVVLATVSMVGNFPLTTAMVAAPIVASFFADARRTAIAAAGAVTTSALTGAWLGLSATPDYLVRLCICAVLAGLATLSALLRTQREARLRRMIVIAETAQRAVLRSMPTAIGSVGLAARYVSATAEALVGGDLYEVAETPFGVRVIVGDVRGKGLAAVQTAAAVLGAFRAAAFAEADPAAVARRIDETISMLTDDEEFVTALVGEFHADRITLANCGHHPPLVITNREVREIDTGEPSLPLGLGADPVLTDHPWTAGSRMFFFTDGLIETRDRGGRFFPLQDFAAELGDGSAEEALDRLIRHLLDFSHETVEDDVALLLAQSTAATQGVSVEFESEEVQHATS